MNYGSTLLHGEMLQRVLSLLDGEHLLAFGRVRSSEH
jgi:hypothetical protein